MLVGLCIDVVLPYVFLLFKLAFFCLLACVLLLVGRVKFSWLVLCIGFVSPCLFFVVLAIVLLLFDLFIVVCWP